MKRTLDRSEPRAGTPGPHNRSPGLAATPLRRRRSLPPLPQAGRLSVTGSATVSVTPDVASVYLSVVVSKPTVKEACDVAAATTAAVTAAVAAVAGTEVSTQNINVRQDVTWADGCALPPRAWRTDGGVGVPRCAAGRRCPCMTHPPPLPTLLAASPPAAARRQERVKGFICENSLKVKAVDSNSTQLGATVSDAVDAALKAGGDHMQARRVGAAGGPPATGPCGGPCGGRPLMCSCMPPSPNPLLALHQVQNMATELSPELRLSTTNRARKAAVRDAAATAEILAEVGGGREGGLRPGGAAAAPCGAGPGPTISAGEHSNRRNTVWPLPPWSMPWLPQAAGVTLGPIKTMSDRNLAPAPTPMPHANTGGAAAAAGMREV